jgi:tetratricopeptide (TPR) repeat protein
MLLFEGMVQTRAWDDKNEYDLALTKLDMSKLSYKISNNHIFVHEADPSFAGPASVTGDAVVGVSGVATDNLSHQQELFQILNRSLSNQLTVKFRRAKPRTLKFDSGEDLLEDVLNSANTDDGAGMDRLISMDQLMSTDMLGDYSLLILCRLRRYEVCLADARYKEATLEAINSVGGAYAEAGSEEEALRWLQRHIDMSGEHYGEFHEETLLSKHNFALVLSTMGKYQQALDLLQSNLCAYKQQKLHEDIIDTNATIADIYSDVGDYKNACSVGESALKEYLEMGGEECSQTCLMILNNLANAYGSLELFDKAEEFYLRALKGKESFYGKTHPETLGTVMNFANHLGCKGQVENQIEMLERVKLGFEDQLCPDHEHLLAVTTNLAIAYVDNCELDKALPLMEGALEGFQLKFDQKHPSTLAVMVNLAQLYMELGYGAEKARKLSEDAVEGLRETLGEPHPKTRSAMSALGHICKEQGELEMALDLYKRVFEATNLAEEGEGGVIVSKVNVITIKVLMGESNDEVVNELESAVGVLAESGREFMRSLQKARKVLAELYKELGRIDRAKIEIDAAIAGWAEIGEKTGGLREVRKCRELRDEIHILSER